MRPNKPVMFAVEHKIAPVLRALADFKKTIAGKKTLFIETDEQAVRETITTGQPASNYGWFVLEAKEAGLEIVPLDERKTNVKIFEALVEGAFAKARYGNIYKREKRWLRKLEGARSNAVIVMHPAHASKIIMRLKIPKENIAYLMKRDPLLQWNADQMRASSEKEAKRIEKERLERYRRKAQARRAGQKPKAQARRLRA